MSDLEKKTVAELKELAESKGVDLTGITKKADIVAAIEGAGAPAQSKTSAPAVEESDAGYTPKVKPVLTPEEKEALELREAKQRANPAFRRQEWWRYKKLGGKDAPWRQPRGIHSKMRRHYKYRPPVVSVGYRTPAEARGLHPSGFEEVLVHRPEDLASLDNQKQGARIGGTVGGRKAAAIVAKADELGIRVFNRGGN